MDSQPSLPNANVYIDGFNLYHGCFDDLRNRPHWKPFRWLDLYALSRIICQRENVNRIRYFTALVDPHPGNPDNITRQITYIRALETIPCLTVHRGRFATNEKRRPLANPGARPPTALIPVHMVPIIEREEKGSDVNLASYLLLDAFRNEFDLAIVITNDSDLAEPIRIIRREFGKRVRIVNPRKSLAYDLQGIADYYSNLRLGMIQQSQFPDTLTDANGQFSKPLRW